MKKSPTNPQWETLRQLPPELDLRTVNEMIAAFPPEPPPRSWTDYLTHKTKWIMSISLFAVLTFLYLFISPSPSLPSPSLERTEDLSASFSNELSSAATIEEIKAWPPDQPDQDVAKLGTKEVVSDPDLLTVDKTPSALTPSLGSIVEEGPRPAIPAITPVPTIEDGIMIPSFSTSTNDGFATSLGNKANSLIAAEEPAASPMITISGEPIHEGEWELEFTEDNRPQLRYRWREKGKGWKAYWSTVQPISNGELQRINQPQMRSNQIGRVYLEPKGKKRSGTFTFYLDVENAQKLEALGANPERIRERTGVKPSKDKMLVGLPDHFVSSNFGGMWFRYFALGVDNEYLQLLLDYGTTTQEFYDFWMLANQGISHKQLAEGLQLLPQITKERIDLETLSRILKYDQATEKLAFYAAHNYQNKTAAEVEYLVGVSGIKGFAKVLADLGYEDVDKSLLAELRSGFVTEELLRELAPEAANVEALVDLAVEKKRNAALLMFKTFNTGGSSPHAWGTSCTEPAIYTQALPSFTKAVIRGNIRVVIRKGEVNQMTTIALPGKEKLVMVVEKDGVLYLSAPKGADRTFNYDIQLTAKDLTQLKVKTKGCVWLDGTEAQQTIKGDGCPTRNFQGKWIEVGADAENE